MNASSEARILKRTIAVAIVVITCFDASHIHHIASTVKTNPEMVFMKTPFPLENLKVKGLRIFHIPFLFPGAFQCTIIIIISRDEAVEMGNRP